MFTDWTMTDPHYFYIRGVVFGVIVTNLVWLTVMQGYRYMKIIDSRKH